MSEVIFRAGNIFARGADLTVLPCSDRGHISAETRVHLERYSISPPSSIPYGEVKVIQFPGTSSVTKWIAFAASVSNRTSSIDIIHQIGKKIGELITTLPDVRIIESPLLGTGIGGLDVDKAGNALRDGFKSTCCIQAVLYIYCFHSSVVQHLNRVSSETANNVFYASAVTKPLWDVFISHSHENKVEAEQLLDSLPKSLKIFISTRCLHPGDDWDVEIPAALRQSAVIVVLISSATPKSLYQREEIAIAINNARQNPQKHIVIPIVIEPDQADFDMPFGLGLKQRIVVHNPNDLQTIVVEAIIQGRDRIRLTKV